MTSEEMQVELKRIREILVATLNYHLEHYTGSIVFDQWDPAEEYYLKQIHEIENDFQKLGLDELQERWSHFKERLCWRIDLGFTNYIKQKTGYDIDIFEDLRKRVASIIAQNKIDNVKEAQDVSNILQVYQKVSKDEGEVTTLRQLLDEYNQKFRIPIPTKSPGQITKNLDEKHSPNHKHSIFIRYSGSGVNALTSVAISVPGGSGSIYCARGTNLPIKAYWKDDSTIIIETSKNNIIHHKHEQVKSYQYIIKIEYVET